jgi:FemAB-related protein (PEP-CTERM system-associated)
VTVSAVVREGTDGVDLTIADVDDSDEARWNAFTEARPEASLCHLFAWRPIVERSYRLETHFLMARANDDRTLGVLPLVLVPGLLGRPTLVSMPFLDQGGILADSTAAFTALRGAALKLAAACKTGGLDLRGGNRSEAETDRFLAILPLPPTEVELWKLIGPKVRNLVRKAQREGLTCRRAERSELPEFYSVFARNMWEAGSPVHALEFFENIMDRLGDRSTLYLVRSASREPLAGGLAIRFKDTVTVPWASALPSALPLAPNYCLYWSALVDAQQAGAAAFDFGRSSRGSGTLHFKKQWGVELRPLRWTHVALGGDESTPRLLDPRRNLRLARIWSRLPLSVANRLGPSIRRRLSN